MPDTPDAPTSFKDASEKLLKALRIQKAGK